MPESRLELSLALTAAAGIIIAFIVHEQHRNKKIYSFDLQGKSQKDILQQILELSAPIAAANELASTEGKATCTRFLGQRQLVITADAAAANYVFNGPNKGNFVRRPADEEGLHELGMLHHGLIWNNDLPSWRKIRGCFQKALGEAALSRAVEVVKEECIYLLHKGAHPDGKSMNLLMLARKVTFRATLNVFFGLKSTDFWSSGIKEDIFIAAIVSYFKAWEFFLFRSSHSWDAASVVVHRGAVTHLRQHVRLLLAATVDVGDAEVKGRFPTKMLFVDLLCQACHEQGEDKQTLLEQSALEMLLAGTDTSCVTAYYALLGLAGDASLQQELRLGLSRRELDCEKKTVLLDSVINETLRFKPVGPVVLREAVLADPNFPGAQVGQGAAILVHLAEMNLREEYWKDPKTFSPKRFLDTKSLETKVFFPFGEGPKGCIGMHLGRREVAAIIETVISQYDMSIDGAETLTTLETHWDIANQPDKPTRIRVRRLSSA
jgi:cytochrome P450